MANAEANNLDQHKSTTRTLPFSVNLWGSKPHQDDNCHTGEDYETLEEARKVYDSPFETFKGPGQQSGESYYLPGGCWVELVGPGVEEERELSRGQVKRKDDDEDWRREQANEAGMLGGCEAYNEVMGYD
jgi:hypothetical protein